jgi:polysaccharide export outer membrane protein
VNVAGTIVQEGKCLWAVAALVCVVVSGCADRGVRAPDKAPVTVLQVGGAEKGKEGAPVNLPTLQPEDLIEPGDTLEVIVRRGAGEEKYAATVRANGVVTVSFVDVEVKGLSEVEAEARITDKLLSVIRNPSVQVRIAQKVVPRAKNFYIFGEVKNAGKFAIGRRMTLLQALSIAGGYTDIASLDKVVVVTPQTPAPLVRVANLQEALATGDLTADLALEDNDLVFVPRSKIGDFNTYYNRALLPFLNTVNIGLSAAFIGKLLYNTFATTAEPGVAVSAPCWVARALYGDSAWQVRMLRWYIWGPFSDHWYGRLFAAAYERFGERTAVLLKQYPSLKRVVRPLFDRLLDRAVAAAGERDVSPFTPPIFRVTRHAARGTSA